MQLPPAGKQARSRRRATGQASDVGRELALAPLVADQYASSWFVTTLPQANNVNLTCVGRVFDRYLSCALPSRPCGGSLRCGEDSRRSPAIYCQSRRTRATARHRWLWSRACGVIGESTWSGRHSEQELIDDLMVHDQRSGARGHELVRGGGDSSPFTVSAWPETGLSLRARRRRDWAARRGRRRRQTWDRRRHGGVGGRAVSASGCEPVRVGRVDTYLDGNMTGTVETLATA